MKTSELSGAALDWAVARAVGRSLREPVYATNEDVKNKLAPFQMFEVAGVYEGDLQTAAVVRPVTVTRYGINASTGATAPSIDFTDAHGRRATGSVGMFFMDVKEAQMEARLQVYGGLDDFSPSTNLAQGGPILTEQRISRTTDHSGLWIAYIASGYGDAEDDHKFMQCDRSELVAGLRCFVASRIGDEVEIPKELL